MTLRTRVASQRGLIGSAVVCGIGWVLWLASDAAWPIVLPMLAMLAVAGVAIVALWDRQTGAPPVLEIGAVYVAVVSLYMLYPLLGFLVNGLRYTPLNDNRLFAAQPSPVEIGGLAWYYVAHLASFVAVYVLVRGPQTGVVVRALHVSRRTLLAVVFLYVTVVAFFFFLGLSFDLTARTYAESYLVAKRLPLMLAQLSNHLSGIQFTLELVLLAALFANYRRYRLLIAGWLVVLGVSTFVQLGSRSGLILLLLAAALMYHGTVRPLPLGMVAVAGVATLAVFVVLGYLRSGFRQSPDAVGGYLIFGAGEFENILANAYDLKRLQAIGAVGDLPLAFHLADLLVIPQQLLPFAKVEPATWYVSTLYPEYAAAGGGYVFGTIAQAILGGGWIDVMARGAVLGLLLGLVHRYCMRRPSSLWAFVFYVWATVLVYNSFRNTTFFLLLLFLYRFLPVMLAVKVLSALWAKLPRAPGRSLSRTSA